MFDLDQMVAIFENGGYSIFYLANVFLKRTAYWRFIQNVVLVSQFERLVLPNKESSKSYLEKLPNLKFAKTNRNLWELPKIMPSQKCKLMI